MPFTDVSRAASAHAPLTRRQALRTALAASVAPLAATSYAQAGYPSRPVTFIVPFTAGGGTDLGGRLLATQLTARWNQSVVVDNKPGAAGIVGVDLVVKAKPDGYTLLIANVGTQAINPTLYPKLPYNPDTAFTPIAMIAELPFVLAMNPKIPAKTVKELVALLKANPGKHTFASSGSGGSPHLTAEIFQKVTGTQMVHVPYKGGGAAMADLIAGHVDMIFASVLETAGYIKAGKLRALAVTSATRSPALPEVPTLAEAGFPGGESGSWLALLGPAGMAADQVQRIAADVKAVMGQPDTRQTLISQGGTPQPGTPEQLRAQIAADTQRYAQVIRERNVRVE